MKKRIVSLLLAALLICTLLPTAAFAETSSGVCGADVSNLTWALDESGTLTVSGSGVIEPKNIECPIGTPISKLFDACGGLKEDTYKLIMGGPMMGLAIVGTDLPVLKQNNAILAFTADDAVLKPETDCIRCGRCVAACPMSLMPTNIVKAAKIKDVDALKRAGVTVCMECGSCAFACPAGKPLVQHMRLAKAILREEGNK